MVKLRDIKTINSAKEFYRGLEDDARIPIPNQLPNTWGQRLEMDITRKRRHYWIWSENRSRGKTENKDTWNETYRVQVNPHYESWWDTIHRQTEAIIFDGYHGKTLLGFDELEKLCDGKDFRMNRKGEPVAKLDRKIFVIILSNSPISDVYVHKKAQDILYERFIEINVD